VDSDFSGRRIVFVRPSTVIQQMIGNLIRREFEVVLVPRVSDAKAVFFENPKCLAFINIDEGLTEDEWTSFAQEVQDDPALKAVRLGVLTYNHDLNLAETYLMKIGIPCGFIRLSLDVRESTETMVKVLEANEARGRRKYLRVQCDENTRVNFKSTNVKVEGPVLDLSSVGMSCVLNPDLNWPKGTVFRSIQLNLKGSLCMVDGVIFGSRQDDSGNRTSYLFLFEPHSAQDQLEKVRTHIQTTLQDSVDRFLLKQRSKGSVTK